MAPLCMLAFAWAAPAAAQVGAGDDNDPAQLEEMTVNARRELDERFMSTASRVVIGRRDIEAIGANSVGDILRQTPGLQVTTTPNGGLEIRMRGMGTEQTRVLVDGIAASNTSRSAQLPLDELPADLIERIEVIRAPSAEFQGAAGGSVNIVLRGAQPRKETFMWLNDQYVWGKHSPSVFISQTGPLSGAEQPPASPRSKPSLDALPRSSWSYFLSLNTGARYLGSNTRRETSTNTALTTESTIDEEVRLENHYATLTPRVTGRLGARDRVTFRGVLSAFDQEGRATSVNTGLSNGVSLFNTQDVPWHYHRNFLQGAVDWSHSFTDGKWDTTLQLEGARSTNHTDRNAQLTLGAATTPIASRYDETRSERAVIAKTKVDIGIDEALLSFGGDLEIRNLEANSFSTVTATPSDLESSIRRKALWGQYDMPVESWRTSMTFGLRAQDFSTDATSAGATAEYHSLTWQPSFNSRTRVSETTQFRFNLARISRNPRIYELARLSEPNLSSNSPNSPDFVGNPNLRPESTITMDMGLNRRLVAPGERVAQATGSAGVNFFVRSQSDVIRRRLFLLGTRWTETPDNIGDALVWGLEADVRTNLVWAGLPRDWTLSANASLLNSRLIGGTSSGERIPGQARYLANLNVARPMRISGGWFGGLSLHLIGASDQNTPSGAGVDVTGRQRSHSQLDMFIGNVIPRVGFWRLNLNNVTDYRTDRSRVVANTLNGVVTSDHSVRHNTPRILLTLGTRF